MFPNLVQIAQLSKIKHLTESDAIEEVVVAAFIQRQYF